MREAEAVVDTITKEVVDTVEEGVEMTVDTEESEELAMAEDEADTMVRETCIFLSSLKS